MDPHLIKGALDMLVLDVVSRGPNYGYQIAQTVLAMSDQRFELKEGSLYPALHRLKRRKLLTSYWVDTPEGRRRKYYRLTPAGRRALKQKKEQWTNFTQAVQGVLYPRRAVELG